MALVQGQRAVSIDGHFVGGGLGGTETILANNAFAGDSNMK